MPMGKIMDSSIKGGKNEKYPFDNEKNYDFGKDKCKKLKEIRKLIAEVNGIKFEPDECHHKGPCAGTCPACDAEIEYIDKLLQLKKQRGEKVYVSGLSVDIESANFDSGIIEDIDDDSEGLVDGRLDDEKIDEEIVMGQDDWGPFN